jgi:hypothetical protein
MDGPRTSASSDLALNARTCFALGLRNRMPELRAGFHLRLATFVSEAHVELPGEIPGGLTREVTVFTPVAVPAGGLI